MQPSRRRPARSIIGVLLVHASLMGCVGSPPIDREETTFAELVALSATRLDVSRKVALTKWDTHAPVADPPGDPREQQVIAAASEVARARGLSTTEAAAFFADQIEASKLMQYALMAEWQRAGLAPSDARSDLASELRPALDALQVPLIDALVATESLRQMPDCSRHIAAAASAHAKRQRLSPLTALALDRALARVCKR